MLLNVYKSRVWVLLFMLLPFMGSAQIPGLPAGWEFTLNPTSGTYAIQTDVAFDGVDALAVGDWVGAFYNDGGVMECGGAVEWDGTNVAIVIFGNDTLAGDKNGFSEGEMITWKFYRDASSLEEEVMSTPEFNWTNGALDEVLGFYVQSDFTIEIPLYSEYQFVSSPIVTDDMNMLTVLDPVLGSIDFVRTNDGQEVFFVPFPPPGNWVNTIGDWVNNDGYYFHNVPVGETLTMTGELADPTLPIDLPVGYRFVGYPYNEPQNALDAFDAILDDITFIRTNEGKEIFFVPFPPPGNWVNTIGDCQPGDGYYIQVDNPITGFTFPEPPAMDATVNKIVTPNSSPQETGHFSPPQGGQPTDIWKIVLGECNVDGVQVEDGDELAVFDGENIVGLTIINGFTPYVTKVDVFVNLYTVGAPYSLVLWDESAQEEIFNYEMVLDDQFGYNGTTFPPAGNPTSYATSLNFIPEGCDAPVLLSAVGGENVIDLEWEAIPEEDNAFAQARTGHFNPPVGGQPTDIWKIVLGECNVNGVQVEDGDELAVFDGANIVGLTVINGFTPYVTKVDVFVNLYTVGAPYALVLWDESEQMEIYEYDITLDDQFGYSGTTFPPAGNPTSYATALNFIGMEPTTFNVYYEDGTLVEADVEGTTYQVTGLEDGTEYCFYVTENLEDGESCESNVLCATTDPGCPPINAFAGNDIEVCASDLEIFLGEASFDNGGDIQWSTINGLGTFDDENILNATYFASPMDVIQGSIELCITVASTNIECPAETDCLTVTFLPLPVPECPVIEPVCIGSEMIEFPAVAGGVYTNMDGDPVTGFDPVEAGTFEFTLTVTDANGCVGACSFDVIVNPLPVVECPEFEAVCEGSEYIEFPEVEMGVYLDEGGNVVTGFDPVMAGSYNFYLGVTDLNGCLGVCEFTIVVNPMPMAECPEIGIVCEGSEIIEFPVVEMGVYTNEAGEEVLGFDPVMAGTYMFYLTVTNEFGCMDMCEFEIEVMALPVPNAGMDATINSEDIYELADASIMNLEEDDFWWWETSGDGAFDPDVFALNATYLPGEDDIAMGSVELCLYVQSFMCGTEAVDCMTLTIVTGGCIDPPTAMAGDDAIVCADEVYPLAGEATNYASVMWTSAGDGMFDDATMLDAVYTPGAEDLMNGMVELCLTAEPSDVLCEAVTDCMMLSFNPLPFIDIELSATEVCLGESITATVNGPADGAYPYMVSYTINGMPFEIEMPEAFGELELLEMTPGTYEGVLVSIEDANGCMAMPNDVFTVVVNPLPIVECPEFEAVCAGSEYLEFPMVEMGVYTNETGDEVMGFDPVMAGTYMFYLTVTNEFGCMDMCEFVIDVNPVPVAVCPEFEAVCAGTEYIEFPMVEMGVYTNEAGEEVLGFDPVMAGTYTFYLTLTNEFGCMDMCMFEIMVNAAPVITAQPVDAEELWGTTATFEVMAENVATYEWYFDGMVVGTEATLVLEDIGNDDAGDYYVMLASEFGCTLMSDVVTLTVSPWTQVINFGGKVNGFSTYLELINDDAATIFAGVDVKTVSFRQPAFIWTPANVTFAYNEEKGAKVTRNVSTSASTTVQGYPTLGTDVDLYAGENFLPVWSQDVVMAADVLGDLGADLNFAWSHDFSGFYWPAYNIYTLQYLVPGSSYLVSMANGATVSFDVPAVNATVPVFVDLPANKTSWNDATLTATQHNVVLTTDAIAQLEAGDVVGAFNQYGQMAGMVEIVNLRENTVIRSYGDDPSTKEIEGFVEGDVITIKVWRNGVEIAAQASFVQDAPNQNVFAEDGVSVIEDLKMGATAISEIGADLTASLYPNPATDVVNIQTNFEIKSLKVVNYVGQVVFNQNVNQNDFQINTSNYGSGMYFVQIENNEGVVITKRLTIK